MLPTAPHNAHYNAKEPVLFLACELREHPWTLGVSIGHGHTPRERTMAARDRTRLLDAVAQAKSRCGLGETAPGVSCDDAGRAGFWLHRFLQAHGILNSGGDSSSIAVNCRQRRAKSEALDVRKVLRMLRRSHHGEPQVWRVGNVPSVDAAEQHHRHRALDTVQQASARTKHRLTGVCRNQGGGCPACTSGPNTLRPFGGGMGRPCPVGCVDVSCGCMRMTSSCRSSWWHEKRNGVPCFAPRRQPSASRSGSSCRAKASGARGPGS